MQRVVQPVQLAELLDHLRRRVDRQEQRRRVAGQPRQEEDHDEEQHERDEARQMRETYRGMASSWAHRPLPSRDGVGDIGRPGERAARALPRCASLEGDVGELELRVGRDRRGEGDLVADPREARPCGRAGRPAPPRRGGRRRAPDQTLVRSSPVAAVALAIISSTFGSAMPDCRPSLAYLKNIEKTGSPRLLSCWTASICGGRPSLNGLE